MLGVWLITDQTQFTQNIQHRVQEGSRSQLWLDHDWLYYYKIAAQSYNFDIISPTNMLLHSYCRTISVTCVCIKNIYFLTMDYEYIKLTIARIKPGKWTQSLLSLYINTTHLKQCNCYSRFDFNNIITAKKLPKVKDFWIKLPALCK